MRHTITLVTVIMAVMVLGATAWGQVGVKATPVFQGTTTIIGQPIQFPLFRNQVTATLFEIAPGGRRGRHQHPVPSVVYILEGALTVEIEGYGQQVFTPGQAFIEPINTWHAFFNRGTTPVKFLAVFAGEQGKPIAVFPAVRDPVVGSKDTRISEGMTTIIGQPILFPLFRNRVTGALVEFAPGAVNPRHQYPAPTVPYILEGTMTMEIEGHGQQVFTAGQAFIQPINTWNANSNRGTTPLKFFVVFFGEEGTPLTVRP